jgi:hypothetical protein
MQGRQSQVGVDVAKPIVYQNQTKEAGKSSVSNTDSLEMPLEELGGQ